jgi:SNF2 family DNA or RNA helicase
MAEKLRGLFDKMSLKHFYIWGGVQPRERAAMQEKFNTDPKMDIMLGTEAMSAGLNFTSADIVINYDDNWAPAVMRQREDRAHRLGQKNVVTVINFVCRDTIEERIRSVLYSKECVSAEALGDNVDEQVLRRLGPREIANLL